MGSEALLKKVKAGTRIVFDDPDKFCLVLKGRIDTSAPGLRQEMGPGGVITSGTYAYALENSEVAFVDFERLSKVRPDLAARLRDGGQEEESARAERKPAKPEGTVYFYSVDVQCPVCDHRFKANKIYESKLRRIRHDSEMRPRFEEIEPVHFKVWVCPNCLYANFISRFQDLTAGQKSSLKAASDKRKEVLASLPEPGEDAGKAINNYLLAIECLTQVKAVNSVASAWLNLAWLYDDRGDAGSATAARKSALEAYERFYFEERSLSPSMEIQALYIIGELNKRLGNLRKAHEYFLKVLHYRDQPMAILTELARDGLQELKQMARETA
jgi:uncharacterized protein (DUF2225 family)